MKIETDKKRESDTESPQIKRLLQKYKYIYAKDDKDDNNELTKKFYGINNLDDLKKKINNIKDNRNFYQVIIYPQSKIYFDLDHLNHTREEIDEIIDIIINEINKLFDVNINIKDLIIQSNNNKTIISSLHIIIKNFYTDRYNMKKFIKHMKEHNEIEIDDIYTKTRQFRLCNNKKIDKEDNKYLVNYNNNEFDIFEEWIDTIDNLEYKKIKDEYIIKDIKQEQKIIISKFDDFLYYELKEQLNKKFYFKNQEWKKITLLINKFFEFVNMSKEEYIDDFLYFSAEQSNGKYTFEQNKEWFNNNKDNKNNMTIRSIIYILNNNNDNKNNYTLKENITNNYIDKIINITNLKREEIIKGIQEDKKEIEFENNIIYNKSNKLLYYDDKIYNLNEDYYKYKLSNNKLDYDKTNIKPDEIEKYIDEFIQHKQDIFIIRGKWGCGKTYLIMKPIIKNMNDKKILIITENNTLNLEYYNDLKEYGFITHQKNGTIKPNQKKIIISLESLHKLGMREFDLVIFDEFETIISHLESKTIYKNYNKAVNCAVDEIYHYINTSKQLLFLDADISKDRVNNIIYKNRPKNNNKYFSFTIDNDNYKDCKYNIYLNSHNKIRNNIIIDTLNNSSFVLSSTTKYRAENYYNLLFDIINKNKLSNKICIITSEGVKINSNNYDFNKKKEAQANITQFLEDNNIDIFIFTPTFKTGANIRKFYKRHYSIGCNNSVNVRIYNQMLHRTRNLESFHIYIEKATPNIYYTLSIEDTINYIKNINIVRCNNDYINNQINITQQDKKEFIVDKNYLLVRAINYNENYNQKRNFLPYLIYTLKFTHNSNIIYIDGRDDKNNNDNYIELIAEQNEKENKALVYTPIINKNQLEIIQELKEYEEEDKNKINKYYKLLPYNIPVIEKIKKSIDDIQYKKIYNSFIICSDKSIYNNNYDFEYKKNIVNKYNNEINKYLQIKIINNDYYETYNSSNNLYKFIYSKYDYNKLVDVFEFVINNNIIDEDYYKNNNQYIKDGYNYINLQTNKYIYIKKLKNIIIELCDIYLYKEQQIKKIELYNEYNKINKVSLYNQIKKDEYKKKFTNIRRLHGVYTTEEEKAFEYNILTQEDEKKHGNELQNIKAEDIIKNKIIRQIITILKINISSLKIDNKNIITNSELFELYKTSQKDLINLELDINNNFMCLFDKTDKTFQNNILEGEFKNKDLKIQGNNKNKLSNINKKINKLLNRINIIIKYIDIENRNTARPYDKLTITNSTYDIEIKSPSILTEKQKTYLKDTIIYRTPNINNNNNYDIKDLLFDNTKTKIYNNQLQTEDGKKLYKYKVSNFNIILPKEEEKTIDKLEDNIIYRPYQYNKKIENKFKKISKKKKGEIGQPLGQFIQTNIKYFQNKELYFPNINNMNFSNSYMTDTEETIRNNIPKKHNINIECHNCLDDIINKINIDNNIKTITEQEQKTIIKNFQNILNQKYKLI